MDDAVANDIDLRKRGDGFRFSLPHAIEHPLDGVSTRGNFEADGLGESLPTLDLRIRELALPFDLRLPQTSGRVVGQSAADLVKAALLAAGARIQHENFHSFGLYSVSHFCAPRTN